MQSPHRFPVSVKHRDGKRRSALRVLRFEIGAKLDQQIEGAIVLAGSKQAAHEPIGWCDHVVERCLFLLEFRETPRDRLRVIGDYASQQFEVSQRDRGEHVMSRAALDEEINHVATSFRGERCPSDDVHSMKIADPVHIGSTVEQRPHRIQRAVARGEVQRERVITVVSRVGIRTVLKQQPDGFRMTHCGVKTGGARLAFAHESGFADQQFAESRDISRAARSEEGIHRCLCRRHGCRL